LTVGVTVAVCFGWLGVLWLWPEDPPALEPDEGCGTEPDTPGDEEDGDGGETVVVLVDSLEDDEEEEEVDEADSVVVVEAGPPPPETGGLIAGAAPPEAGQLSVTTVMPPPSAESATRRSQRRGVLIPALADPSLIACWSPDPLLPLPTGGRSTRFRDACGRYQTRAE
jgi:hypothetical protein